MTALALTWREMRPEDRNYVLSSWLRSYADSVEFRAVPRPVYFRLYEPVVKDILARSTVLIACEKADSDVILGYLVTEGDVVHFALVKPRWRRVGIGRWMAREVAAMPAVYTHAPTLAATRLLGADWTYEPLARFGRKEAA